MLSNISSVLIYLVITITGVVIGSLVNQVVYYLPKLTKYWLAQDLQELDETEEIYLTHDKLIITSFIKSCTHCTAALNNKFSLFYWIAKKGKCKKCNQSIAPEHAIVELFCGAIALIITYKLGFQLQTILMLLFAYSALILVFTDIKDHIIPDSLVIPLIWIGMALSVLGVSELTAKQSITGTIMGYLSLWGVSKLASILARTDEMGRGDLKLMAAFGAWFGGQIIPVALLATFLIAGGVGGVCKGKIKGVAFAPYIVAGWLISLVYGNDLMNWYQSILYL